MKKIRFGVIAFVFAVSAMAAPSHLQAEKGFPHYGAWEANPFGSGGICWVRQCMAGWEHCCGVS